MLTNTHGFVGSMPSESVSLELILQRFGKLNNIDSLAKPSFLNQSLYGPWHLSTNYMDLQSRYFANIVEHQGQVKPTTLKEFVGVCDKLLHGDAATYERVEAIQAYRDHRIPLAITKSREIYVHCIEYREAKYYSLIKNGSASCHS